MSNSFLRRLQSEDHCVDGVALMVSQPARLMLFTNLLVASLLIAAVIWAWFAKADVIVATVGAVAPESDIRRVYVPIDGELVDVYVATGMPVQAGDVVARINARGAIDAASKVVEANIQLADAKHEYDNFPARKALLERKTKALADKVEFLQTAYNRQVAQGMTKLANAQRARLSEARNAVDVALRAEQTALGELQQYERLFSMEGGGGVSSVQVEQKRTAYLNAQAETSNAQGRLSGLEYDLSAALAQADKTVALAAQELSETRIQWETSQRDIEREAARLEVRFRTAQLAAEAAQRVSFENFDENNFLKVLAPVDGVVTDLPLNQRGDKILSSRPLLSIAPSGVRKVLKVSIPEKDRGFLKVGQLAKLKFNAFPYQSYGSIDGRLEYISPTVVKPSGDTGGAGMAPGYEATISLVTDELKVGEGTGRIRFGMNAVAEIVVRERRVIDYALDPLKRFN